METQNSRRRRAFAHYNLGVVLQREGRLDEAARQFETEMTITPQEPWSYENRGQICHPNLRSSIA